MMMIWRRNLLLLKEHQKINIKHRIYNLIIIFMMRKKVSNIKKKVFVQDLLNYFQFLVKKRRMKMFMKWTQQESLKICFKDITHIIQIGVQMFKFLQSKFLQIFNNIQIVYYQKQGLKLQGNQKSTIYQYHNQ